MIRDDPSEAPRLPRNPRDMWRCRYCREWNDCDQEICFKCDYDDRARDEDGDLL